MLLLATTSLGIGFGLTVPALNTFTAAFFPQKIDSAVLMLNALLGVGTALAPVLVAIFIHILYGMLETMSGNWAAIHMSRSLGATTLAASLALTVFWGMVTAGRLLFAGIEKWLPDRRTYRLLPLVIAAAFLIIAGLSRGGSIPGILAFGLSGLGCSALLPLTISFGQAELGTIAASVAGGLIAFYQVGYGMTAFGIGPLQEHAGLSLDSIFGFAAVAALLLTALSFVINRHDASALSRLPRGA